MHDGQTCATASPLQWPNGKRRARYRQSSRFKTSFSSARDGLLREINLLGGRQPVISSDLKLRQDGLPLAKQRQPDDPGVAVYFTYNGKQMCFACDKWSSIGDNIQAVRLTIEALRGIERWGSGDMMAQAFHGFEALPAPEHGTVAKPWWVVLDCSPEADLVTVTAQAKKLRMRYHPDRPEGDADRFHEITQAYEQACKNLAGGT